MCRAVVPRGVGRSLLSPGEIGAELHAGPGRK
jgi:hypothetical protein